MLGTMVERLRREIQVFLPRFWVLHLLISKEAWVQIPLVSSFDSWTSNLHFGFETVVMYCYVFTLLYLASTRSAEQASKEMLYDVLLIPHQMYSRITTGAHIIASITNTLTFCGPVHPHLQY